MNRIAIERFCTFLCKAEWAGAPAAAGMTAPAPRPLLIAGDPPTERSRRAREILAVNARFRSSGMRRSSSDLPEFLIPEAEIESANDADREDRLMRFGTSLALLVVGVVMGCVLCSFRHALVKLLAPVIPGAGH